MVYSLIVLAAVVAVGVAHPLAFPEEGFRPVLGARGHTAGSAPQQASVPRKVRDGGSFGGGFGGALDGALDGVFQEGFLGGRQGGGGSFGSFGGGPSLGEPDKTIYVRLPSRGGGQRIPPRAAGPPQKHYRIVIIRSPSPPVVQPILPPRTEQKTIIYVLHQKPKIAQQQIIQTPVVKHPPQVLFVGYDNELSSKDLQQLAKGDHTGFSVSDQQAPVLGGSYDGSDSQVFGGFDGLSGGYSGGSQFGGNSVGSSGFGTHISSLQPFHASGSSFSGGGSGFYSKRSAAAAPPGRVAPSS